MENDDDQPNKKKRRLSLSLQKDKKRFDVTSREEVEAASVKFVPKNTTKAVNWSFRVFKDWIEHSGEIEGRSYKVDDLWSLRDPEAFVTMMSRFCLEVKQQNGSPYTPKSLLQMMTNLQSYARSQNQESFYFMCQNDERLSWATSVVNSIRQALAVQRFKLV